MATIEVWTDGGCWPNPGRGAYAYILRASDGREKQRSGIIEGMSTNNRAELTAVVEALQALRNGPHDVKLFTDSEQVRLAVVGMRKPKKNLDLIVRIGQLVAMHRVTVERVAGHAGVELNERCDALASAELR